MYKSAAFTLRGTEVVTYPPQRHVLWCVEKREYYRGAYKSLARPTCRCILFDGEYISFDASLVIYINSTNISPVMIINRIDETQNLLSL